MKTASVVDGKAWELQQCSSTKARNLEHVWRTAFVRLRKNLDRAKTEARWHASRQSRVNNLRWNVDEGVTGKEQRVSISEDRSVPWTRGLRCEARQTFSKVPGNVQSGKETWLVWF